jgi:hypothetical protein
VCEKGLCGLFDEEMVQAELDLLMVAAATKSNPHITQE